MGYLPGRVPLGMVKVRCTRPSVLAGISAFAQPEASDPQAGGNGGPPQARGGTARQAAALAAVGRVPRAGLHALPAGTYACTPLCAYLTL